MKSLICHITTVHVAKDMRIFYKECASLSKAGYEVKLLVINGNSETTPEGVEIIGIPCSFNSKFQRFYKAGTLAFQKALSLHANLYHFHDPEFLWFGYKLMKQGKKVIYDVHEDVPRQILGKSWIPLIFRKPLSFLFEKFENHFASKLSGIATVTELIATRFEKNNHRVAIVKNFPILSMLPEPGNWENKKDQLCYIGDITQVRGIVEMVLPLAGLPYRLALGGKFSQKGLRESVIALEGWQQVIEYGFVDRNIAKQMLGDSKIGFILLHPIINYQDAIPVKLFEFMAAGIPVIASDLRFQKSVVEEIGCGIVVNPFDTKAVRDAIQYLFEHPDEAQHMGMKGRKAVEEKFNWKAQEQVLLKFYQEILSE